MLGTSILRLRSEAASQLRGDQLMAVTRVGQEITSVLDRRQVLSSIARRAAELSQSDACGVFDLRSDGRFYLAASYGISEATVNRINAEGFPMEGSAVGLAVGECHPVQIPDIQLDPTYKVRYLIELDGIRAVLALPMLAETRQLAGSLYGTASRATLVLKKKFIYRHLPNKASMQQ